MGKLYEAITPALREWIGNQKVFFVATAPLSAAGHVNTSPKGLDSLRILGERRVAYLDLTGSGSETIAHLRENGRIVVMFCAFDATPKIVRLHGRGSVIVPGMPQWGELRARFPGYEGARAIIDIEVSRVSDSCGFGVPVCAEPAERPTLQRWAQNKGPEGLSAYRRLKNSRSIDGLPALDASS
jgi:hypothetical protein